jgi:hypothetical protein
MNRKLLLREIASTLQTKKTKEGTGSESWRNKPLWDWNKQEIEDFCSGVKHPPRIFPIGATDKEKIQIIKKRMGSYTILRKLPENQTLYKETEDCPKESSYFGKPV